MRQTFNKGERLSSKRLIEKLFKEGQSFYEYPFRVIYLDVQNTGNCPVQVLISASKRNYKKAVDRNKVKRLVREGYRKNKHLIYNSRKSSDKQLLISLIYTAKTILSTTEIESKIILILQRLIEQDEQAAG